MMRAGTSPLSASSALQNSSRRAQAEAAARAAARAGAFGTVDSGSPSSSPPRQSDSIGSGILSPRVSLHQSYEAFTARSDSVSSSKKRNDFSHLGLNVPQPKKGAKEKSSPESTGGERPAWRKILWAKQPYDDNYVDKSFMQKLVLNKHVRTYDFFVIAKDSAVVNQQLAIVLIFLCTFLDLRSGSTKPEPFIAFGYSLTALTFVLDALWNARDLRSVILNLKAFVIVFAALLALTPILGSLTAQFSSDTVWAMSSALFFIHLLFNDYRYVNCNSDSFKGPDSVNAAILASVLLASRLPTNAHSLALLSFAVQSFALFPFFRHSVKRSSEFLHQMLTYLMVFVALYFVYPQNLIVFWVYLCGLSTITVGAPLWLIYIQKYKKYVVWAYHMVLIIRSEISGPWDEAKPARTLEDFLS